VERKSTIDNRQSTIKNACVNHADRVAVVTKDGAGLCWQCYLPEAAFVQRFGPDFYENQKARKTDE